MLISFRNTSQQHIGGNQAWRPSWILWEWDSDPWPHHLVRPVSSTVCRSHCDLICCQQSASSKVESRLKQKWWYWFFSAQLQHLASIPRAPVVMCLNFQLIQFSSSYTLFKNVDWKALTICLIKKWKPFETKVVNVI